MLTRLKVNGFKNLVDVDVRFGPFTCIAGVNGSGKSNLFDAIRFLALLAEKPLLEAAREVVRGSGGRSADIRSLFHRVGDEYAQGMSFEADMIVPSKGIDDLGQRVRADATFVRYGLKLIYQPLVTIQTVTVPEGIPLPPTPQMQIADEHLVSLSAVEASDRLRFARPPEWFESAVSGEEGEQVIRLQDDTKPQHERRLILRYDDPPRRELYYEVEALPSTTLASCSPRSETSAPASQNPSNWYTTGGCGCVPNALKTPKQVPFPEDARAVLGQSSLVLSLTRTRQPSWRNKRCGRGGCSISIPPRCACRTTWPPC